MLYGLVIGDNRR